MCILLLHVLMGTGATAPGLADTRRFNTFISASSFNWNRNCILIMTKRGDGNDHTLTDNKKVSHQYFRQLKKIRTSNGHQEIQTSANIKPDMSSSATSTKSQIADNKSQLSPTNPGRRIQAPLPPLPDCSLSSSSSSDESLPEHG